MGVCAWHGQAETNQEWKIDTKSKFYLMILISVVLAYIKLLSESRLKDKYVDWAFSENPGLRWYEWYVVGMGAIADRNSSPN